MLIAKKYKYKINGCSKKIFTKRISFAEPYSKLPNKIVEFIKILALVTNAERLAIILSRIGVTISHDSIVRILKKLPNIQTKTDKNVINVG